MHETDGAKVIDYIETEVQPGRYLITMLVRYVATHDDETVVGYTITQRYVARGEERELMSELTLVTAPERASDEAAERHERLAGILSM